MKAENP